MTKQIHHKQRTRVGAIRRIAKFSLSGIFVLSITLALLPGSAWSADGNPVRAPVALVDQPCIAPDDGSGTVNLPPNACDYSSPDEEFMIIDGLPPGTYVELTPILTNFVCKPGGCGQPGGNLGGEVEQFEALLVFQARGSGELDGYRRTLRLPIYVETHSGPRTPGDPLQTFPTELTLLGGNLPPGDPDFASLQITAGSSFGVPSPGMTTLTDLGDDAFSVQSFFDITYQISFEGAPGGQLEGLSGVTTGVVRISIIQREPQSVEPDNGDGTITLPPLFSRYLNLTEDMIIYDGLPPGTTILVTPVLRDFLCTNLDSGCGEPGGSLGREVQNFSAKLDLELAGTGMFSGYRRSISLLAQVETHSGPRNAMNTLIPQKSLQMFPAGLASLEAALTADPDFASLVITSGTNQGLPSFGHFTLIPQGDGSFMVDSFFDISYQIEFLGAPGSVLEGLSGNSQGMISITAFHDQLAMHYRLWFPWVTE